DCSQQHCLRRPAAVPLGLKNSVMRVRFFGSCVAASACGITVGGMAGMSWWAKRAPVDQHAQLDGRETPAELLTSYDGCRPRWRRQDLPNCQTSASADQVHYIRTVYTAWT